MTSIKLYGSQSQGTLANTLQDRLPLLSGAIALLYSPYACQFARLDSKGQLVDSQGSIISPDYPSSLIFTARIFNSDYEFRWLNQDEGVGKAVIIAEQEIDNSRNQGIESVEAIDTIEQTYLLWGEKTNTSLNHGWQRLATARIGKLDIPIDTSVLRNNQRVYLNTREYLALGDEYQNVVVVEERLLNLEVR